MVDKWFRLYVFNLKEENEMKKYWQKFLLKSTPDKAKILGLLVGGIAAIGIGLPRAYGADPFITTAVIALLWIYVVLVRSR